MEQELGVRAHIGAEPGEVRGAGELVADGARGSAVGIGGEGLVAVLGQVHRERGGDAPALPARKEQVGQVVQLGDWTRSGLGSGASGGVPKEYGCMANPSARMGLNFAQPCARAAAAAVDAGQLAGEAQRGDPLRGAGGGLGVGASPPTSTLLSGFDRASATGRPPCAGRGRRAARRGASPGRPHPLGHQEDGLVGLVPGGPQADRPEGCRRGRCSGRPARRDCPGELAELTARRSPESRPFACSPRRTAQRGAKGDVDHHLHAGPATSGGGVGAVEPSPPYSRG